MVICNTNFACTDHGDHVLFSQGGNDHVLARTRLIGGPIKIYEIDTQFRHKWWTWCQQQACLNLMEEGEQLVAICQISLTRLDIASPTVRHQHLVKHGKNNIDLKFQGNLCHFAAQNICQNSIHARNHSDRWKRIRKF